MSKINITLKLKLARAGQLKGNAGGEHEDEIRIERYAWGTEPAGAAADVRVQDFEFWAKMSSASPQLMIASVTGEPVVEAVLSVRSANANSQTDYLVYTLTDGVVSTYQTEAAVDSMIPLERFAVRFRKLAVKYRPTKSDGTLGGAVVGEFDSAAVRAGNPGRR